jgi:hypothetical protein
MNITFWAEIFDIKTSPGGGGGEGRKMDRRKLQDAMEVIGPGLCLGVT